MSPLQNSSTELPVSSEKAEVAEAAGEIRAKLGLTLMIVGATTRTLMRVAWEVGILQVLTGLNFSEAGAAGLLTGVAFFYMLAQIGFSYLVPWLRQTKTGAEFWTDHLLIRCLEAATMVGLLLMSSESTLITGSIIFVTGVALSGSPVAAYCTTLGSNKIFWLSAEVMMLMNHLVCLLMFFFAPVYSRVVLFGIGTPTNLAYSLILILIWQLATNECCMSGMKPVQHLKPSKEAKHAFDIVVPMYEMTWCTRAVLEGLTQHYSPRCIHIVTPPSNKAMIEELVGRWHCGEVCIHDEDHFFPEQSKDQICSELALGPGLYKAGWFYQQLLKIGAGEGIKSLSEWYLVWDADMLPVSTWPIFEEETKGGTCQLVRKFALIQHNQYGNAEIVSKWHEWIRNILGVEVLFNEEATFVPHHMWFKQEHARAMQLRIQQYFKSKDHWARLMLRSVSTFETFSEYWMYASWVAHHAPKDLAFHPYSLYGFQNERFFDDGHQGLFSKSMRLFLQQHQPEEVQIHDEGPFLPSYAQTFEFIQHAYGSSDSLTSSKEHLPSTINFEQSVRHLEKLPKNMHLEELRSRWNMRKLEAELPAF
eukprot:TRINITY_DN20648_c0_g1_i1.p1 TRINITY_DN20648_c0_g1~~TRINITY_DN20648_c0_g1_i1.p1  ORF type:complete len:685 (+),score=132.26 TRINITY_DN20648_c0_g1_i1:287-2056(+)